MKMRNIVSLIFTIFLISNFLKYEIKAKKFKYFNYDEIWKIFENLSRDCSDFIKIDTSQNRYGLPSAGNCGINKDRPCSNLIVFITDFETFDPSRPQVYFSGLVHGDEVLGATVLTEFAQYICNQDNNHKSSWVMDLLKKTYIVLTPFTNAYGYSNKMREDYVEFINGEVGYEDPNRDFPYFNSNNEISEDCMKTIAARTVNELFREHLFINVITFHGGLNAIGYPWGNYLHLVNNRKALAAPDNIAAREIANLMKIYSSSSLDNNSIPDYSIGDMIEVSYPVDGGMEDWAYAAGWEYNIENQRVSPIKGCQPKSFNGYKLDHTNYRHTPIKSMIYLIETGDLKTPNDKELGTDENLFDEDGKFYGHVTRNIRIVAALTDLANPQIKIQNLKYERGSFYFEFLPMGCMKLNNIGLSKIFVNFENLSINKYKLSLVKYLKEIKKYPKNIKALYEEIFSNDENSYSNIVKFSEERDKFKDIKCYWNQQIIDRSKRKMNLIPNSYNDSYNITIDLENFFTVDEKNLGKKGIFYFLTGKEPDKEFGEEIITEPNIPPQTHLVNLRISDDYNPSNENYYLRSQKHFSPDSLVLLMDNGIFLNVDDLNSFFLSTGDINFQFNLNPHENLGKNFYNDEILKNILTEYKLKPVVKIENNFETDGDKFLNFIKTSNFKFKLSLHLMIFSNQSNFDLFMKANNNSIDELQILFNENITDKNFSKQFIKMKKMIINENNLGLKEYENWCSLISVNDKIFNIKYYIACDNITGNYKEINFKLIKNNLLGSLFNIQLPIEDRQIILTGTYNMKNPYLPAKSIKAKELICISNFNKEIIKQYLFSLNYSKDNSELIQNGLFREKINYLIKFKKISDFILEVTFKLLNYSFIKNDEFIKNLKGAFVKIGASYVFKYDIEQIKSEKSIVLHLTKDSQIVGSSILVYWYQSDSAYYYLKENLSKKDQSDLNSFPNNISSNTYLNECTLLEKKDLDSIQEFENFYDFDSFHAVPIPLSVYKNSLILAVIFAVVVIILVLLAVLYIYLKNKSEEIKYEQFEMDKVANSDFGASQIII